MQDTPQQQISLPYQELPKTLGRDGIRAAEGVKNSRATYMVPFDQISLRIGFNIRSKPDWMSEEDWEIKLEVKQLAENLKMGKECPDMIKGDFITTGPEPLVTLFILTDGERRYRAIKRLLSEGFTHYGNGKSVNMVEVLPNPSGYTEYDRNRQFYSSNNNMKYTDLQWSELCWRMKNCFMKQAQEDTTIKILSHQEILAGKDGIEKYQPLTNDDIATELGRSRQWVGNMLVLHELPDEIKKRIDNGEVNYTDAIKEHQAENPKRKKAEPKSVTVIDDESGEVLAKANEGDTLTVAVTSATGMNPMDEVERDDLFEQAIEVIKEHGTHFFASLLQRHLNLGYMRAGRIIDQLIDAKIIEANEPVLGSYRLIGKATDLGGGAALQAELNSHKTDPNFKEARPKGDREDALEQRDFKTDKEECDMNLNEVQKYLDKLEVQIGYIQDHVPGMKQAKGDMLSLINGPIRKLLRDTQEKLKKAPEKGTIS